MKDTKDTEDILKDIVDNFDVQFLTEDCVEVLHHAISLTKGVDLPDEQIRAAVSGYEDGTLSAEGVAEDLTHAAQREACRQTETNPQPQT